MDSPGFKTQNDTPRPPQPTFVRDDGNLSSQPDDLHVVAIHPTIWDDIMGAESKLQKLATNYETKVGLFKSFSAKNPNRVYVGIDSGEILFWLDEVVHAESKLVTITKSRWVKIVNLLKKSKGVTDFLKAEGITL